MDSLGYPIMPNFGAEVTDNSLGSTSAANAYTTDTNTQSHNTSDAINNTEFSARGTSDISVILDQLMTITDQVNHRITFTLNYWKFFVWRYNELYNFMYIFYTFSPWMKPGSIHSTATEWSRRFSRFFAKLKRIQHWDSAISMTSATHLTKISCD